MPKTPRISPLIQDSEPIQSLFRNCEVYGGLNAIDFREMGKFAELTNIAGLPVHSIQRPVRAQKIREFPGRLQDLPDYKSGDPISQFRELFSEEPTLLIRGRLAQGCSRSINLTAFVPQSQAHLAQALDALLWPLAPEEVENFTTDLYFISWPNSADQLILHLPASKLLIMLGTDDLRAGLLVMIESAHRLWSARTQEHELQSHEEKQARSKSKRWEDIRLLPGGSFVLQSPDGEASLVFLSESVPDEWEHALVGKLDLLRGRDSVEVFLAGAEPWVAEGGGLVFPFWRNSPLPAQLLALSPDWENSAIHPDALPFGVSVSSEGRIELAESREDAFVVIPRAAIPVPFARSSSSAEIKRIITYKFARGDAMELWARGFPAPEII